MVKLRSPLYAQIETTYVCNLGCSHCYNEPRFQPNSSGLLQIKNLKKEQIPDERFPEIAKELARNDVFSATITGGEVFTLRDRLFPTLEVLAQEGLDVHVNSNLTMTTEEDAKQLKDSGVSGVLTSIISYDPETYDRITQKPNSHRRLVRGINELKKQGLRVSANIVVSQHNRDQVYQTGVFANELGIDSFQASQAVPSCNGGQAHLDHTLLQEDLTNFLEELHQIRQDTGMFVSLTVPVPYCSIWESKPHLRYLIETSTCSAGRTMIQIDPEGNVRPCPMVGTNYGNILEDGLPEVWQNMQPWRNDEYVPAGCQECDLVSLCRGACRAEAERFSGGLSDKNPFSVKPVKLNEKPTPVPIHSGMTLRAPDEIKVRKEDKTTFTLYAPNKKHMLASESTARLISIARNGITINEELMANHGFVSVVTDAYNKGVLNKVA